MGFAEDKLHLNCLQKVRKQLTQQDYITSAESAYPCIMEEIKFEKDEKRKEEVLPL